MNPNAVEVAWDHSDRKNDRDFLGAMQPPKIADTHRIRAIRVHHPVFLSISKQPLSARAADQGFLPIEIKKYVMLLDWTGRELRRDKRGAIPDDLAPILDRLGVDRSNWVQTVRDFGRMFKQAAGRARSLVQAAPRSSRRWFQGKAAARVAFL